MDTHSYAIESRHIRTHTHIELVIQITFTKFARLKVAFKKKTQITSTNLVRLEVALPEKRHAILAFEGQYVRGYTIQEIPVVTYHHSTCEKNLQRPEKNAKS